ncbi:predicted protein [Lichtheimia corymbifera JMRC:FSU:9682]|uniref:COX assembly mitochondrial protein n=1 Tax=Lichtheimia corymbifera JMRC:FSU:9682 TaxID=1263082 RepID=A0A068SDF6_9FUNG|nr:predicted protein [Lichtheimia corymbifera JMRC:FSU:9682]
MADRNPGTAREYVESYVKDQDLDSFLSEAQPQYDPTKKAHANASPQQRSEESTESENKTSLPLGYNRHRPTMNPMATGEEQQENKKEKKEEEIPQRPKIMWVVRDFMDQKREIHEKAIDNCADLHVDLLTCFKDGSWWDKAKMCEHQKQKFWKCYQSQKDFLKKANYKGPVSTPEHDKEIEREAVLLSNQHRETTNNKQNDDDSA